PDALPIWPRPLGDDGPAPSLWAPVRHAVAARARPAATSRQVARLDRTTPERTTNIVLALGRRVDRARRVWVKVSLPVLPNGTVGWVRRTSLGGYVEVTTYLVVDLGRLTATLTEDGRRVFRPPIGIGKRAW